MRLPRTIMLDEWIAQRMDSLHVVGAQSQGDPKLLVLVTSTSRGRCRINGDSHPQSDVETAPPLVGQSHASFKRLLFTRCSSRSASRSTTTYRNSIDAGGTGSSMTARILVKIGV